MATWATASVEPASAPGRRARPRTAASANRRVAGGVVWIVVLAALLAGVVALNVTVLRLNMRLERLSRERADLQAKTAQLSSQLSSSAAAPRIQGLAARRLGLVPADPATETTFVHLK